MKANVKTLTLIIIILLTSLLWAIQPQPVQAMKRESKPVVGEIVEGRSVIVNLASGRVFILEV